MAHILWLDQIEPAHRDLVGGKGLSLARLHTGGFDVPAAFVLTTRATLALDAAGEAWPPALRDELLEAWRSLAPDGEPVAVRSSALDEDGEAASFAGQHETVLDVRGEDALLAAVRKCLASLHSEAAVAYRARAGGDQVGAAMAVVVQRMVPSKVAGVAFSIDPITGDARRVVVEAVAGAGEALVSGVAEGDRVVLGRPGLDLLEEHHPGAPVLTHEFAREAAAAAIRAEGLFASPQDVEFATDGATLWMLQSRPITAAGAVGEGWLNEFDTPTTDDDLWTSANVQEVLPGLLTPMTMTLFSESAHKAYTLGYQQLKLLAKDEWPNFVGLFYNRAFINVGATRVIAERGFGSSGDAVEHRYLGGPYVRKARKGQSLKLWKYRLQSMIPLTIMTLGVFRAADRIERETHRWERRVRRVNLLALSGPELEALRQELVDWASRIFAVHLQATGVAGAGFDGVSRLLEPVLRDETESRLPALFTGVRGVESAQIGLDLWELSRVAKREGLDPAVRASSFDPSAASHPPAWRAAFAAFLERHGHRGLNEMEPAALTWRQDPSPVIGVIRSYLDLPVDQSPPATLTRQEKERLRLTRDLAGRMNVVRRQVFLRSLRQAQQWVALRERTKSIVVRAMRISDYYVPEAQQRLVAAGALERPEDLFFLSNRELTDFLLGKPAGNLKANVLRRRREYERNRHVVLPERFHGHPKPITPDLSHHTGDVLRGTPVSPGTVTGRARVILDPATDGPMQPGEILVAPVTDAGWTPLFALASGLVVDMGSALSHGSTVAREYGLPAVVNVRGGTRHIRTGDLVTVNGSAGTVTIIESATVD